jgi:eukaryotic-like serine/threonine-protein kinase
MFKPYNKAELHFDFINEIGGDGRNSKTFVSLDHQLNAEIVIKQIDKAKLTSADNFFDESKALYASAHPNVVQIHYACQDAANIYLAMPFYRKGSVKALITGRHMTVREIVAAGCQIISALHNIHSKGLIHFDVKPDNILLSDRGEALLSDFGLAKPTTAGLANPGLFYSKMIPPEAPAGATAFNRTWDIYQLGLTLYRMCNGNDEFNRQFAQFGGDRTAFYQAVMAGNFPNRRVFPAHVPQKLRNIIRTCLNVHPVERYQSALDVANQLAEVEDLLDWRLSEADGTKTWTRKNESRTEYTFLVNTNGSTEFYQTPVSGQRRRINNGFKPSINDRDLRKLLGEY